MIHVTASGAALCDGSVCSLREPFVDFIDQGWRRGAGRKPNQHAFSFIRWFKACRLNGHQLQASVRNGFSGTLALLQPALDLGFTADNMQDDEVELKALGQ